MASLTRKIAEFARSPMGRQIAARAKKKACSRSPSATDASTAGGGRRAPAGIDDRTLDVYAIELRRRRDLIGLAYNFKSGDFVHSKSARHYRTSRVLLETEPELGVNLDGEVEARTPKLFSVAPDALRVIVPQESTAARDDAAPPARSVSRCSASWSTPDPTV